MVAMFPQAEVTISRPTSLMQVWNEKNTSAVSIHIIFTRVAKAHCTVTVFFFFFLKQSLIVMNCMIVEIETVMNCHELYDC